MQVSRPCAIWAAGILLALLTGSFLLGASVSAAYLSHVGEECALRRAEAYKVQDEVLVLMMETKQVIGEFLCARRGICLTDPRNSSKGQETAFGP